MKERPWVQMWNTSWNLCDLPTCTSLSTCSAAPAVTEQKTFGFFASATKGDSVHRIFLTPPLHLSLPSVIYSLSPSENIFLTSWMGVLRNAIQYITLWVFLVYAKGAATPTFWLSLWKQNESLLIFNKIRTKQKANLHWDGDLSVKWSLLWLLLWSDLLSCEIILIHQS